MSEHHNFGKVSEEKATKYLLSKGYEILERNYRVRYAEIDIIAKKSDILIIVEVKSRRSDYFGKPQEAVTVKKIKLLTQAAHQYVVDNNMDVEVRFDIIAILENRYKTSITHIENAFLPFHN